MNEQNLEIVPTNRTTSVVVVDDSPLTEASIDLLRNGLTEATWKAYKADRNHLVEWGTRNGVEVLPATPNTVTNYVSSMEGVLATSTICRRVAFWSWWHDSHDLDPNPCRSRVVRQALKGLRHRSDRPRQARPMSSTDLARRGASTRSIARQTGHSPTSPVLHRYVRLADPREDNAVTVEGWL